MTQQSRQINVRVLEGIEDVAAAQWDGLVRNNYPFLKHGFLAALEKHQCVGRAVGWIPRHLCYLDNGQLVAAMPLYEKHNSWGEFVFDHAWADAFQRYGIEYYPKLVNSIPFTPATGQRLLLAANNRQTLARNLIAATDTLMEQGPYSGVHCLFPDQEDFDLLDSAASVCRDDCQFHWYNRGYSSFDDFLVTLKSRKRKNIRQERRKVAAAGITIRWMDGASASEQDWHDFTRVYQKIYDRKYGMPAFNLGFFQQIALAMPQSIQLVLAEDPHGTVVAGALMYRDDTTLYGRHWGCDHYVDSLHFELCYYQGIEFCIREGLARFDPGAQGEHKIARGFEPVRTRSLHWMGNSPFSDAIRQFVEREQVGVKHYIDAVFDHTPYNSAGQ
jgi:predicted N-acyltransferase